MLFSVFLALISIVTVPGEAGEKVETETHHEIIPGASETKEETREATLVTEIGMLMENIKI